MACRRTSEWEGGVRKAFNERLMYSPKLPTSDDRYASSTDRPKDYQ